MAALMQNKRFNVHSLL